VIPYALGKGDSVSLRKKKHSNVRARLKSENLSYLKLKEMKRIVLQRFSENLKEMCLKRLNATVIEGLHGDLPFDALNLLVLDDSLLKERELFCKRYEDIRKYLQELRGRPLDITKEAVQEVLERHERKEAIVDYAEAETGFAKRMFLLLAKEHKKHTFERFVMLPKLYDSFCKSLDQLSRALEERRKGAGVKIKQVVIELLLNSNSSEELEKSQRHRADLLGVRYHKKTANKLYRDHGVMGREKEGSNTKEERDRLLMKLNYCFNLVQKGGEQIENFQRSHTLPFPGMFSWTDSSLREALSYYIEEVPEECDFPVLVGSEMMDKIIEGDKEPEVLNAVFESALKRFSSQENLSESKFAFKTLLFLKEIYLRMFSETEFLPDFINSEMDKASEWEGKKYHSDYRSALAMGLSIQIKENCKAVKCLNSYFKTSSQAALKLAGGKAEKTSSLFEQFKLYCLLQVMQSLLTAPLRDTKAIDKLSEKVLKAFGKQKTQ
jgi:hypothetical protein